MTREEARWAQIVFWSKEDVDELHRRERKKWDIYRAAVADAQRTPDWWDDGFISSRLYVHCLQPYWPVSMPSGEREDRISSFFRLIYPVWKGILSRNPDCDIYDINVLHTCDLSIWKMGKRPNRGQSKGSIEDSPKMDAEPMAARFGDYQE